MKQKREKSGERTKANLARHVDPFEVKGVRGFRLKTRRTDEKGGLDKEQAQKILDLNRERLSALQDKLYAHGRWSLLLIFQGMDAAGKDGAIKHVMSGVNPQGCEVHSFKQPSARELDHDFMWRCLNALPERGRIGIFNRSYYEEALVVRVHPEVLAKEKLPQALISPRIWRERFEDIAAIENYLARNGTVILKFFLNISREEQRRRFLKRLEQPSKNWKFSTADFAERALWDEYHAAYEDLLRHTSARHAPWYVVPADHKWYARLVISSAIVETLEKLDLAYPEKSEAAPAELKKMRAALEKEGPPLRKMVTKSKGVARAEADEDADE